MDDINVEVKQIWIPSHLGIAGNETVDQIAQFATANSRPTVHVVTCLELKVINTNIQEFIITK